MLSFVVPAHNESQMIEGTVRRLHEAGAATGVPYEVVVVDDASTDDTAALAARAGARVVPADVRHIAAARNIGARAAGGEHLLFVDADTWLSGETARAALHAMRGGAAGGGARVRFDGPVPRYARPGVAATLGVVPASQHDRRLLHVLHPRRLRPHRRLRRAPVRGGGIGVQPGDQARRPPGAGRARGGDVGAQVQDALAGRAGCGWGLAR